MPKFFVTKQQIKQQIEIVGEDAKHIKTVLRKKEGEENNEKSSKIHLVGCCTAYVVHSCACGVSKAAKR